MQTESLVGRAVEIAVKAGAEYLRVHGLSADDAAFAACLRSWLKIKLPGALADAREAFDAGMSDVAESTFVASIRLAGIEAAKEAGFPA